VQDVERFSTNTIKFSYWAPLKAATRPAQALSGVGPQVTFHVTLNALVVFTYEWNQPLF